MCFWKIACVSVCFHICSWKWKFFVCGDSLWDIMTLRSDPCFLLSSTLTSAAHPAIALSFPQSIQRSISITQLLWTHLDPSDVPDKIHPQPQPRPWDLLAAPQGLFLVGICISTSNLGLHLKDWRPPREACGLLIARPFSFDSTDLATIGRSK